MLTDLLIWSFMTATLRGRAIFFLNGLMWVTQGLGALRGECSWVMRLDTLVKVSQLLFRDAIICVNRRNLQTVRVGTQYFHFIGS